MLSSYYSKPIANLDKFLLVALVFLLPFERIPSVDTLGVTLRLSFFAAGFVIVRAIQLLYKQRAKHPQLEGVRGGLLVFLAWVVISGLFAINFSRAAQVIVFTLFTALTALSITILYKREYLGSIVKALLLSATLVALFGIYQYIGDLSGLPNWVTGLRERYSWQVFGFPRIQSVALEPLYYCSYLLLPIAVVVVRTLMAKRLVLLDLGMLLLFGTSIFLTVSRGGIMAFLGLVIFLTLYSLILKRSGWRRVLVIIAVMLLALGLSFAATNYFSKPPVDTQVTGGTKGSSAYTKQLQTTGLEGSGDERTKLRNQALNILNEDKGRYVLGIGAGQFGPYVQNNMTGTDGGWLIVNNEPLEMLLELGLVGVMLFIVFGFFLVRDSMQFITSNRSKESGMIVLALLGYMFATAIQYQTFSTLYIMHVWVAIGLLMAIVLGSRRAT